MRTRIENEHGSARRADKRGGSRREKARKATRGKKGSVGPGQQRARRPRCWQAGSSGKAKASKAAAAKEKTCAQLSDDDNPKVVARVVGQALKLQLPDSALPKDVLELARQKMPDVDLTGLAPRPALLALAKALVAASSK